MLRYWKKKAKVSPRHFVLDLSSSHTRFVADAMRMLDSVQELQDVVIRNCDENGGSGFGGAKETITLAW